MEPRLRRAIEHIRDGQFAEAREVLVEMLHQDYDNAQAWFWLAHCAADDEEYGRALRETLRLDPENKEARRMAAELARSQGPSPARSSTILAKDASRWHFSLTLNFVIFLAILGLAGSITYLWLNWQQEEQQSETNRAATLDAAAVCTQQVNSILSLLPARCSLTPRNHVCLANLTLKTTTKSGEPAMLLRAGDSVPLGDLLSLETETLNPIAQQWGLAYLLGQTSFPDDSEESTLFFLTQGVRLTDFDDRMTNFTFASSPISPPCSDAPPSGVLIHTPTQETVLFRVNNAKLELSGTAFMQLDVAAGFRVAVLQGEVTLSNVNASVTAQAGKIIQWQVESDRLVSENSVGTVSEDAGRVRGNLQALRNLGVVLELDTQAWALPGETPLTVAQISSLTPTEAFASPPPILTSTPSLNEATPTSTPPLPDLATSMPVTPEPPSNTDFRQELKGIWRCNVFEEEERLRYFLSFEDFLPDGQIRGTAALPDFNYSILRLQGKLIFETPDEGWEEVPTSTSQDIVAWLVLYEEAFVKDNSNGDYAPTKTIRLVVSRNRPLSGAFFERDSTSRRETLLGFFTNCEKQP